MLIDPDLHGIFTKRKATVSNLLNDTIPAVGVKYLNDDRWKSLERMPSFMRAKLNQHVANSGKREADTEHH